MNVDAPAAPNLLPAESSGFERGTIGGWTVVQSATLANLENVGRTGARALVITALGGGADARARLRLPVAPSLTGREIRYSAWMIADSAEDLTGQLYLSFRNAAGSGIANWWGPGVSLHSRDTGGWTQLEMTQTVPTGTVQIELLLCLTGSPAANRRSHIDDIVLTASQ